MSSSAADAGTETVELSRQAPAPEPCPAAVDAGTLTASSVMDAGALPTASFVLGDGGVSKSGNVSNAARVVAGMRPSFRACYNALLGRNREAQGTVRVTLRVNCVGRVIALHATAHGIDRETVACMFDTAMKVQFEPPEGGSAVINVPVTFVKM